MILVLLTPLTIKLIKSNYSWLGWIVTPISLLLTRYIVAFYGASLPTGSASFLFTNWYIFYYLGLYIGNKKIKYDLSVNKTVSLLVLSLILSICEGLLWFEFGNYDMATTQLRFTSILSSTFSILLMYKYLTSNNAKTSITQNSSNKLFMENILLCLGDCSFGIYLSHILIRFILSRFSINMLPFPFFSILLLIVSTCCVLIGKNILTKKYSWLLGL